MAEVVKGKERKEIVKVEKNSKKEVKKKEVKQTPKKPEKNKTEEKKSLWEKFMIFCHGVKSEFTKVRWTDKKDLLKYSIATIVFIVFCSLFFYLIDTIFAFVQTLFH